MLMSRSKQTQHLLPPVVLCKVSLDILARPAKIDDAFELVGCGADGGGRSFGKSTAERRVSVNPVSGADGC